MTSDGNPFKYHPELRDKIVDPLNSDYRKLNLTLLEENMLVDGAPATPVIVLDPVRGSA